MSTPGALAETDDNVLVAMVLGGNREAFAAIYDRYADRIHDFGYSMLRSSVGAKELTSVTFVQAARRLNQLGDNRPLYPWLYNLARVEALSRLGGHTRIAMPDDLDPATTVLARPVTDDAGPPTGPTTELIAPTSVIPSSMDSLELVAPPVGAGAVAVTDAETEAEAAAEPAVEEPELPEDVEAATMSAMLRTEAAQRAQIWHAVTELADNDRALLDLHLRHSLEGAPLGQAMGMPPDEAYQRLAALRVEMGRPLGAWLLAADAKAGDAPPCPDLLEMLRGWDGGYTGVIRKKVVRHIDTCAHCRTRHGDLPSPWALYASVPPVFAPGLLRGTVLARAEYAAFADEPKRRWRKPRFLVPIAAAAALLIGIAATVVLWPDDDSEERATGNTDNTAGTGAGADPGSDDLPDPLFLLPPQRTPGPPPPAITPGPAGPATLPPAGGGGSAAAAPGAAAPGPVAPAPPPPPPPPPPDTTPPSVGAPHFDDTVGFANVPRTVRVSVTDASAITSVTLTYAPPGGGPRSKAMSRSGNTWTTSVGPWCGSGAAPAYVTATDAAGNTATGPSTGMAYVTANC